MARPVQAVPDADDPGLPAGVDGDVVRLLRVLPEVVTGLRRVETPAELRTAGPPLGPRHLPALFTIDQEGPITVGRLAERLGVGLAAASLMAAQLQQHRLVDRNEDPADRRRTVLAVNPDHRVAVDRWLSVRTTPVRRVLEELGPEQRAAFIQGLTLLSWELNGHPDE